MPATAVAPSESVSFSESAAAPAVVHFSVQAAADPAALSRVIEYFALNTILPETVRCRRYVDGDLVIDVKVKGLDEQRVSILANKLRSCVLVFSVAVEWMAVGSDRRDQPLLRTVAA